MASSSSLSSNWKKLSSKIDGKDKVVKKKRKLVGGKARPEDAKVKKLESVDGKLKIVKHGENGGNDEKVPNGGQGKPEDGCKLLLALLNEEIVVENQCLSPVNFTRGNRLKKLNDERKKLVGKYLAMDCEFVGVGPDGNESALARVSMVNYYGNVIYDVYVKPRERVTDWRTWVSGITARDLKQAVSFREAQEKTAEFLQGRVLVGHSIHHDLEALFLSHPNTKIRDTSRFARFRKIAMGKTPSLKKLSQHFLQMEIQGGQHSSVEDARATMLLFRMYRKEFEQSVRGGNGAGSR